MRDLTVLVVEDNAFTRSTLAAALESRACRVAAAVGTAAEAMQAAQQHRLDCAVVDLHLGTGPTGVDVAHALRRVAPEIGVVILTSYEDPRLLSADPRPLPARTIYLVKGGIASVEQLRQGIEAACGLIQPPDGMRAGSVPLTDTQMELLRMVAMGLTNAEIARRRVVTERAVETSLARILRRLGIDHGPGENPRVLLTQAYFSMIGGASVR